MNYKQIKISALVLELITWGNWKKAFSETKSNAHEIPATESEKLTTDN